MNGGTRTGRRPGLAGRAVPLLLLLAGPALWACGQEDPPPPPQLDGLEGVVPPPGPDPVRPDAPPLTDPDFPAPAGVAVLAADTAQGWSGPGGEPFEVTSRTPGRRDHLYARIGLHTFPLPARTTGPALTQYPCTSCHEGAVAMGERVEDAHRNIQPVHPAATGATCATCHVPDSVHRLVLHDGQTVSMDHAYRLCAQCHAPETRSWAAGVHGKRLEGWHGRRVVMNCADCHDPHSPALQPRIPFPGPRLESRRGGSP
jgi:hypothetical protein